MTVKTKALLEVGTFVVTMLACLIAAIEASITRRTFEEEMRRRERPALVPSSSATANVVESPTGLRVIAKVQLSNQGGGSAYHLQLHKRSQIPTTYSEATASKEAIFASLSKCKEAFGVEATALRRQIVVGSGQTYDAEFVDEISIGAPNASSTTITRRLYILCLYKNEAHRESGTIFSVSLEFQPARLNQIEAHVEDVSVLEADK